MAIDVLDLLKEIQADAFTNAAPLPLKRDVQQQWQGLGFQIGGVRLVAPLGEITEIVRVPRLTKLPGTKHWVMGVANIRGHLLPVIDAHRFLGLTPTIARMEWRVLVVEDHDVVMGFLVEQSLGMQYFLEESFESIAPADAASLRPYIRGAYRHGGRVFYVASLKSLVRDGEFFDVAEK